MRPTATPSVETLEDRLMPDAALLQSVPPSLLSDPLIVHWNAEHDALTNITDRVHTLQTAVQQVTTEVATDQVLISSDQLSLTGANQNLQSSIYQQQALTLQGATLQAQEAQLRTEQSSVQQQIGQLQTEIVDFQKQLTTLGTQRSDLQKTLDPLVLQMQQLQKDLASVTQELKLRPKSQKLLNQRTTISTSIALLQPQIDSLKAQIAAIDQQIAGLQTIVQNDTAAIATLQLRLAAIPGEINLTHTQWISAQSALQVIANTITLQQQTVQQIRTALDAAIAELAHDQETFTVESQDLFAAEMQLREETQLVESLDAQVNALVERTLAAEKAPEVIAPAMFATVMHEPGWGFKMHIRYQTPSDTSFFQISEFGRLHSFAATEVLDHPGGTRDRTVELSNRGDPWSEVGVVAIRMMDGPGGNVFQTMYALWNSSARHLDMLTKQPVSFEDAAKQSTEQVAEGVEPAMQVETEGRILYVRFQTGSDQSFLAVSRAGVMDPLGSGSQESFVHAGGIREGLAQLAIPANAPINTNLILRLWDKSWGNVVSEVTLQYDGTNVQVIGGQKTVGDGPMPHAEVLRSVMASNAQIRSITGAALYERSGLFVDGSSLGQRLAIAFPSVFPQDFAAAVEQMYQAGPTYTRGFYEDQLLDRQADYRNQYSATINAYGNTMANLLLASVDFWIRVRSGETERPLSDALHATYDTTNFGAINMIGIPTPSFTQILDAGRDLCGCQRELIMQAHLDSLSAAARTAYLESVAISGQNVPALTPISADAHRRTMQTILQTSGTTTPEQRLANYVKANPEAFILLSDIAPAITQSLVTALLSPNAPTTGTLVATAGTTDAVISYLESVVINKSLGLLKPQSFAWPVEVRQGQSYTIGFSVDQPILLDALASVSAFEEARVVVRSNNGTVLAETTVGTLTQTGTGGKIHQTLLPGDYRITFTGRASSDGTPIAVSVGGILAPISASSLEGTVEMGGQQTTVQLKGFGGIDENTKEIRAIEIDKSKVTWIVIHGRGDSPASDSMKELAQSLYKNISAGQQVITLDWSQAAAANMPTGLSGANWITKVSDWSASALKQLGIANFNINIVGQSWGTYLIYEIAARLGGIGSIVALDPARDLSLLGAPDPLNSYDPSKINFAAVSQKSIALHSSVLGSTFLASTADYALAVNDNQISLPVSAHNYAVTAFSWLLMNSGNGTSALFNTANLQGQSNLTINSPTNFLPIQKKDGLDGSFNIHIIQSTQHNADGTTSVWWKAVPDSLDYVDPAGVHHLDKIE